MRSTVPSRDNDYRFPPAPARATLTREAWDSVMADLSARMRVVEAKGTELDDMIADLSFNGQTRIDQVISPLIEEVRQEVDDLTAAVDKAIQDASEAATAVAEMAEARVRQIEIDLVAVEAAFEEILSRGVPVERVSGLAAFVAEFAYSKAETYTREETEEKIAELAGTAITEHADDHDNPHQVTAEQVGLGQVSNLPSSTARDGNTIVERTASGNIHGTDIHASRGDGMGAIYLGDGCFYRQPNGQYNLRFPAGDRRLGGETVSAGGPSGGTPGDKWFMV